MSFESRASNQDSYPRRILETADHRAEFTKGYLKENNIDIGQFSIMLKKAGINLNFQTNEALTKAVFDLQNKLKVRQKDGKLGKETFFALDQFLKNNTAPKKLHEKPKPALSIIKDHCDKMEGVPFAEGLKKMIDRWAVRQCSEENLAAYVSKINEGEGLGAMSIYECVENAIDVFLVSHEDLDAQIRTDPKFLLKLIDGIYDSIFIDGLNLGSVEERNEAFDVIMQWRHFTYGESMGPKAYDQWRYFWNVPRPSKKPLEEA